MANKLPYMLSVGLIPKILEKIQNARRPERFTLDFLGTKLGHTGGSANAIIPLLKRLGFLASDGSPTALYDQFRNTETQGAAVAQGMKNAFSELYDRNEYVHDMSRDQLTSLIVEITGGTKKERTTKAIVQRRQSLVLSQRLTNWLILMQMSQLPRTKNPTKQSRHRQSKWQKKLCQLQ